MIEVCDDYFVFRMMRENEVEADRLMNLTGKLDEFRRLLEDADMVILNTCHIREKAAEKVFSDLGRLRPLKDGKDLIIAVAGCVAQAEGAEIMTRAPFVFGKADEPFPRTAPKVFDTSLGWRFENPKMAERFPLHSMGETDRKSVV